MQYQVFVQNQSEHSFVASVIGMPDLIVEGTTEEEALAHIKSALQARLAKGKLVTIEIESPEESTHPLPQMQYAGIFAEDPTFDEFMEKLATIRKQSNELEDE